MEKSKKTLKMIGICIIGLVIVVAVNILKKPEDPFKNDDRVKLGYQHVEESDILNSKDYDSYYVYFYETGNEKCKDTNEVVKSYVRGKSSIYVFNMERLIMFITKQVILKKYLINKKCHGETFAYYSINS